MEKVVFGFFIVLFCSGFVSESQENVFLPTVRNESFRRGEVIDFKMTYGFFTVGKGSARIDREYHKINDRYCFKVDVSGKTVGMVDWVADIDDKWGAYIDTAALVPHQFYRRIREGRYRKDEWTNFDHVTQKIEVKTIGRNGKMREPKYYDAPPNVRDMIGGFLYMRIMDFSKLNKNDTVTVAGFFEDEFYKLKIIYRGKDTIKLKVGKVRALVFTPVMPANKLFDGEDSITAYFSDDKNRIPLKIDAKMFVGSAGVELTGYSGLRNPLNIVK
jgi:hypothetical protein